MFKSLDLEAWARLAILSVFVAYFSVAPSSATAVTCFNVIPNQLKAVADAGSKLGLELKAGELNSLVCDGTALLEASSRIDLTSDQISRLGEYVRKGGTLILTLTAYPGTTPMKLAFMLPTTCWQSYMRPDPSGTDRGPILINSFDGEIFPGDKPKLQLPFCFPFRPISQAERGEGRYEQFERDIQYIKTRAMPGETYWTRPLINRDWRIRAMADDKVTPFLLTGRYGAGRVIVVNTSALALEKCPQAAEFWRSLLSWLTNGANSLNNRQSPASLTNPVVQVDPDRRTLHITIGNSGESCLTLHVLARLLTWEHALVGDIERPVTVAAKSQATIDIQLPKLDAISYQALESCDSFDVRLGILSGDHSSVLKEQRIIADMRPAVVLSARTDDIRAIDYPFHAPGAQASFFEPRMGLPVSAYVYRPGQAVNVRGTISNGCRNIAPLASVIDETQSDNPTVRMLTDGAANGEKSPIDGIKAYGAWVGQSDNDNSLRFVFPCPVTIGAITLIGCPSNYRNYHKHNPSSAIIELDGQEVSRLTDLNTRFLAEHGNIRVVLPPKVAKEVRVRLPWIRASSFPKSKPWLAEIQIEGSKDPPADIKGQLAVKIVDALGDQSPSSIKAVSIPAGTAQQFDIPVTVPSRSDPSFYRVELSFAGQSVSVPFLSIDPKRVILPVTDVLPSEAAKLGFIVTKGFRNVFDLGTGTKKPLSNWSSPDDLIWAYSRQLKQIGRNATTEASRLYVTESDMRHYSTPWRAFANGELFYDVAAPLIVARMRQDRTWSNSNIAILSHSDRWDSGPATETLHGWQDFEQFDEYLRSKDGVGLKGSTRIQLAQEIHGQYESEWQKFQLDRYQHSIRLLRDTFAAAGKQLVISAQGCPLLPLAVEKELSKTIQAMNQDSTWSMDHENIPLTTGMQMGTLALNPDWKMSTLLQWGYNSAVLENPHWHAPVGTTEPSRRQYYDRAWRGIIDSDGNYRSMHTYGYNSNAGSAYTMAENDWQEWYRLEERHSLISPTAPYGAGLVVSASRLSEPKTVAFSGTGELNARLADVRAVARSAAQLQGLGLSISFAANSAYLSKWSGQAPLILVNLNHYSADEIDTLKALRARHVRMVAFAGDGPLSEAAAELFVAHPDGMPKDGVRSQKIGSRMLSIQDEAVLISGPADTVSDAEMKSMIPVLQNLLPSRLVFAEGTSGYGFYFGTIICAVVEDWLEQGREITIKFKISPNAKAARACELNGHHELAVNRDGQYWAVSLPQRPGDGNLICLKESF